MLDRGVRRIIDPGLNAMGRWLAGCGVPALAVTALGLGLGLAAALAIALGFPVVGACLILASRLADGLDGPVARATQPTPFGAFADIVADFIFYAAIPLAFAVEEPTRAVAASVLLAAFIASGVAFLGYALLAAQLGGAPPPNKGFVYAAGLTEGTETIALFLLLCLVPQWFEVLAFGFAAACWITAAARCWAAWQLSRSSSPSRTDPPLPH
ncbi:MAG: CDP-alcohol phosphatidyltransferase family protein [Alphaproteobacteria bacterium]|nr:MAG: CDP-alcohol phosphatidyltransferase family protein [Alphaproteobacteria bacterium]